MSVATDQLNAMIESCAQLETLVSDSMGGLAKAIERELQRTIAAGTSAYGEPWKPTQQGEQPLRHAADALRVMPVGKTIYINLLGTEARHHRGIVKGGLARPIIPIRGLPTAMANAMRAVLQARFDEATTP